MGYGPILRLARPLAAMSKNLSMSKIEALVEKNGYSY